MVLGRLHRNGLRILRHRVSQSRIVRETWGGLVDKPVHKRQLLDDLNRDWTDNRGRRFRSNADVFDRPAAGVRIFVESAADSRHVRHTVVLTADNSRDRRFTGRWNIAGAVVHDPWPGMAPASYPAKSGAMSASPFALSFMTSKILFG